VRVKVKIVVPSQNNQTGIRDISARGKSAIQGNISRCRPPNMKGDVERMRENSFLSMAFRKVVKRTWLRGFDTNAKALKTNLCLVAILG
jgi:hypothetical protein